MFPKTIAKQIPNFTQIWFPKNIWESMVKRQLNVLINIMKSNSHKKANPEKKLLNISMGNCLKHVLLQAFSDERNKNFEVQVSKRTVWGGDGCIVFFAELGNCQQTGTVLRNKRIQRSGHWVNRRLIHNNFLFKKRGNQNYLLIYPFETPGKEKYTLQDCTTKILAKNPMKQKRVVYINLHG